MGRIWIQLIISTTMLSICINGTGQITVDTSKTILEIVDSLKKEGFIYDNIAQEKPNIKFTTDQAIDFLEKYSQPQFWRRVDDPLRKAIEQLVFLSTHPSYNSLEEFLKNYEYDSIKIPWEKFYVWDTLELKTPVTEPVSFSTADSTQKDTSIFVLKDTLKKVSSSNPNFPFRYYSYPFQADSLEIAVTSLIKYLEDRDSIIINFGGKGDVIIPIWLNSKSNNMTRYWLKNEFNDSVSVWIGSIGHDTIGLFPEQGVDFRRSMRPTENNTEARVNVEGQDRSRLLELQRIEIKKKLWKYRTETNLAFSQTGLFNWVKGGESSLTSLFDITGYADYDDKQKKISSNNFVRLKLGFIASGDNPIRKNTDILETSTKVNHKAFGKFDFSTIMLFKTQLLNGYNYPNDSVLVSKILNPAIMTLGLGFDYKPNAQTSINFSPLSYKLTFVTDTANIDQTKYGIPKDKKAMHEPGMNFMFTNTWKPAKNVSLTNRLQIFSNYIRNPQNIDVDWELTFTTSLNTFTELKINTHLIFSDNIKTPVLDKDKNPVLNPDGTEKKTARIQFKEMIGISLAFRF